MRATWAILGLAVTACAGQVKVGDVAPPVRLPDQDGRLVDVADNYGRRWVALAFYPKDDTTGCTFEAKSVTASIDALDEAGVTVYGVSVQGVDSKKAFCDKYGLKQTMLSDPEQTVCRAFGTLTDRGLSARKTFLIDPARIVRVVDDKVQVKTHAEDILAAVKALREADRNSALGHLSPAAAEGPAGLKLRLPYGWQMTRTGEQTRTWTAPEPAGVMLTVEATATEAPSLDALVAALPRGAKVRIAETFTAAQGTAARIDWSDRAEQPVVYTTAVVLSRGNQTIRLSLTAPAASADDASRLLAAVAAALS